MRRVITALWRREVLKFVRDRARLIGSILQPVGFWLLLGMGFQGSFAGPGAGSEPVGYLAYLTPGILAMIVLFTAIFSTISIVEDRKSGFLQSAFVAPVSRTGIALGIALGGATLALGEVLVFMALTPLAGLAPPVTGWLLVILTTLLLGFTFTAMGMIIAWRMDSTRGFHAVMNLVLLPLWILSGAAFPVQGAALPLRWIMLANPVTYAVDLLRQAFFGPAAPGATASPAINLLVTAGFCGVMLAAAVLTLRGPALQRS